MLHLFGPSNYRSRAHISRWADHCSPCGGAAAQANVAALMTNQHLVKIGEHWLLDIPAADTKTRRALEFPLPDDLSRQISLYIARFRSMIPGAEDHDGLWPSTRGRPMDSGSIYDAVRRRTTEALGFQLISIGSDLPRVISGQLQIQPMCAESKICSVKQASPPLKNTTSERNRV